MAGQCSNDTAAIDFYDAQSHDGQYFIYVEQHGEHAGGGASCYFWFSSALQLLNSVKQHMDFWEWRDGWKVASDALSRIIEKHEDALTLSSKLRSELDDYAYSHAGINIYAWGTFNELCTGDTPFSVEVRKAFRERLEWENDGNEDDAEEEKGDVSRPIAQDEIGTFQEFLFNTPT